MHLTSIHFAALLFSILPSFEAAAATFPYKIHREQNIDAKQVGWIDLTIDPQGHGTLTQSWSNGKRTSGNTFYGIVVLVGRDGRPIYSDKQTNGLDASWGGHAREGHVTTTFSLDKAQMDDFDQVTLKMGVMNCGMKLTSFKCCDNGVEASFTTKKCGE
ncbi:hypothetical protein [Bradyrhizobium erythrophlei]|uniref:Uncharacterized protein n=1 Tax=Bradyrhizobium erythrophlei TaxID=1437360 RepID=A0A1H5D1R4_9BRAD|nr:hypothetical protein [Bradyrhizobium erythrophlei]SED72776.1 hypothetical protein SAMN05444164_5606 [Bradyrhizobium erythrophlei]